MKNSKPTTPDTFADMFFPLRGLNDNPSLNDMPPGFTTIGNNVRVYEALTGRARGGSRPGLDKFIPEQHSGTHEIQHVTYIVTVSSAMLGWNFDGPDQSFPGIYGGIGFLEQIGGGTLGFPGYGGGGYQPLATGYRLLKMGFRQTVGSNNRIAMSDPLVVTLQSPAGNPPGITVRVRITNQDGKSGDFLSEFVDLRQYGVAGVVATVLCQFGLHPPPEGVLGLGEQVVSSALPQTVVYYATNSSILGSLFTSISPVRIRWTPYWLALTASASSSPINTPVTLTGVLKDHLGNLVVGKTIRLNTSPAASDGDGDTDTSDGSGEVSFIVQEASPTTITYQLTEESEDVAAVETVDVSYTDAGANQYVQSKTTNVASSGSTDTDTTFTDPVLAGALIVVFVGYRDFATAATFTVSDDLGNTYTLIDSESIASGSGFLAKGAIYYAENSSSGSCTVRVSFSGGFRSGAVMCHEYQNIATSSALVASVTATGSNAAPATGVPTAGAGDLIVGYVVEDGSGTTTSTLVDSPFVYREGDRIYFASSFVQQTADYENIVSAIGASWVMSAANNWMAFAVTFKKL